jgi:nucleotide-binding universal stress UspA family protein
MYERILVPTDGSPGTERALEHATGLAETFGATIHALSVTDKRIRLAASEDDRDQVATTLQDEAEAAVDAVEESVAGRAIDVVTAIRDGIPHRAIVEYGAEEDVDLVVIGTHGRTGRDQLVNLGSVTERVVELADRPVLVVDIADEE